MSTSLRARQLTGALVLLLPAALAAALMIHFADAMPLVDDYFTVVQYSLHFLSLPGAGPRLLYIFAAQHMEYKFVFEHFVVSADLALTRHIHLSFLQLAGDLFLPAIFWLLWRFFRRPGQNLEQRMLLFLPVSLLFCGLNYVDALNFPSAALDYLPAIFFSFAALALLARSALSLALFTIACLCALLAEFSAVNAFITFPLGGFILLRLRAWPRLVAWTAVTAVGFFPYLYHYKPLEHHALHASIAMPLFFVSFVGCAAPVHQLAIPFGLVILGAFAWACKSGFPRIHPASFWCMLWVLLSGAMTAYGRSSYGLQMSLSSRYKIFSTLLLIFTYQICLEPGQLLAPRNPPQARRRYAAAVFFSLLLFLRADYLGWRYFTQRRENVRLGLSQFRASPVLKSPMYFTDPDIQRKLQPAEAEAADYTRQAIAAGILSLPNP